MRWRHRHRRWGPPPWARQRGGGRLFRRIYLHGLLLLAIIGVAAGALGAHLGKAAPWRSYPERLAAYVAHGGPGLLEDPALLARELQRERSITGAEVSVYRLEGVLISSNVEPPLPPLTASDADRLLRGDRPHRHWPMPVPVMISGQTAAYLVIG